MTTIAIIGQGNVGSTLARKWASPATRCSSAHATRPASARERWPPNWARPPRSPPSPTP